MRRAGPRRCSLRGSARGPARAAPTREESSGGRPDGGGRATAARGQAGPERGAEEAAARLEVAAESLGFRTGWLFGCRLREGKSNPQPNFARLARFDAQIPPPPRPRLPRPSSSGLLARSLARWAGPGRAPRSRSAPARCQSMFHANPRAASFHRCHRPLAAGAPRSSPGPAASFPGRPAAPCSGEGARSPHPCAGHAHVGNPAWLPPGLKRPGPCTARTRGRADAGRKSWERGGERGPGGDRARARVRPPSPDSRSSAGVAGGRG